MHRERMHGRVFTSTHAARLNGERAINTVRTGLSSTQAGKHVRTVTSLARSMNSEC
jgi:hypothetical protein